MLSERAFDKRKVSALGISFHLINLLVNLVLSLDQLRSDTKYCNLSDAVRKGGCWMKVDALGIGFHLTNLCSGLGFES